MQRLSTGALVGLTAGGACEQELVVLLTVGGVGISSLGSADSGGGEGVGGACVPGPWFC